MIRLDTHTSEGARLFILMIQAACEDRPLVPPGPSAPATAPSAPSDPAGKPLTPTLPGVPTSTEYQPKPDPDGNNSCFARGCGLKFSTFQDAIAHKCLIHGYNSGKWTPGWARDHVKGLMAAGRPVEPIVPRGTPAAPEEDDQRQNLTTVSASWSPSSTINLHDLGLEEGEASRFAVGDDEDARFYFIKHQKQATGSRACSLGRGSVCASWRSGSTRATSWSARWRATRRSGWGCSARWASGTTSGTPAIPTASATSTKASTSAFTRATSRRSSKTPTSPASGTAS